MSATYPLTMPTSSLPALRNPFKRKPVMERHCSTGESVPLGTCHCWDGITPERKDVLQSWMRSVAR